ncbi:MAG: cation:proton antiporter, partial [Gemmatimonadota bacterium]
APAATTDVLWEYRSRGPLTTTILGIVALDDGLALVLFAVASGIAGSLMGNAGTDLLDVILVPLYEIFGSIAIGALLGLALAWILSARRPATALWPSPSARSCWSSGWPR